ncbi:Beta-glucosidase [Fusarium albosuccineum]|uniref:beta-glucosidase n=1 Tax=Fusarium albosuccineum TaxID=1237068 RepID=A0A8H4L6U7_9HYPO|nr:Beta-glucosidase [Fusarium albosuccineum]
MRSQTRPLLDVEELLEALTLEEKASLLAGCDFWHTTPIPRYNIPSVRFSDGPNGVRGTRFFKPVPALCLPCGTGLGATWNPDLLYEVGKLLSRECEAKGAHVWLGPTVNMLRSPLNGRGFESFSEDPYLSGVLAGAIIRGVQSRGTLAALKHFVANDQETDKISCDIRMSHRALREIYLKPFQIAMAQGGPRVIMASYNKVNGIHASENPKLLQQILREEWNFDGLVLSDWFGTYSCSKALNAGLDVEMPGPSRHRGCCLKLQPAEGIKRSVELARTCKHVFVVVGLNSNLEKEGMDRTTMTLPDYYDDLVWAVLAAQPNAIVITQAGNPFAMPWHSKVKTLVHSWYGGNESGNAVADVLLGKANPSGKLPFTLFDRLQDGPSALSFGNDNGSLYYAEGIFVGYRWFEARGIKVAFPFGHGLSYTTFAISALSVSPTEALVDIENTGSVSGAEVLRLYVSHIATANKTKSRFLRAKRTLAAFAKVHLQPGEKRCVALALTKDSTAVWDEQGESRWKGAFF